MKIDVRFRLKRTDKEILSLYKEGRAEKEIARRLKLPFKMVKTKIEKLRRLQQL